MSAFQTDYRLPRNYVAKDEYAYCQNVYRSVTGDRDASTFSLLWCYAASLSMNYPTFRRSVVSSSSGSKEGTRTLEKSNDTAAKDYEFPTATPWEHQISQGLLNLLRMFTWL